MRNSIAFHMGAAEVQILGLELLKSTPSKNEVEKQKVQQKSLTAKIAAEKGCS